MRGVHSVGVLAGMSSKAMPCQLETASRSRRHNAASSKLLVACLCTADELKASEAHSKVPGV